jgi:hypothetical protein
MNERAGYIYEWFGFLRIPHSEDLQEKNDISLSLIIAWKRILATLSDI